MSRRPATGLAVRIALRVALRLVAGASCLAPRSSRDTWRGEWEAELIQAARGTARGPERDPARDLDRTARDFDRTARDPEGSDRAPPGARAILRRAFLSLPDAAFVRLHDIGLAPERGHSDPSRRALMGIIEDIARDLRVSLRSLTRQRGFAAVAVLTIGLGIGAATTIFSLVNGILLRPLDYPEPERLVAVWPEYWFSGSLFDVFEEEADSYEAMSAWGQRSYTRVEEGEAARSWGSRATGDFLRVLGTAPVAGRAFAPEDDEPGSPGAVVLSHSFWMSRYGGDPGAVGQRLRITNSQIGTEGVPIVGVMPPQFEFEPGNFSEAPEPSEFALTVPFDPEHPRYRSSEYKVVARLKPGVTREQAEQELRALTREWRERYDASDTFGEDAVVVPLKDFMVGDVRPTILLLFGAVGLILLIAVANVANLMLARALALRKMVAVRLALGATTGRVVRHLLTESTLIGVAGSLIGLLVAVAGIDGVRTLLPAQTPRIEAVGVDVLVLGFCAALALAIGWSVGLVPALQAGRTDVRSALGADARGGTGGRRTRRLQAGLLTGEIALAVVLLSSAGLLTKSFWRLNHLDPGFRPDGLVRLHVRPADGRVTTIEDADQYYRLVDERLEAVPGVVAAAGITQAPITGDGGVVGYYPADRPPPEGEDAPRVRWRAISPDYLETAAIPLIEGRAFDAGDVQGAEAVALLSRAAAEELFPGRGAIGERVRTGFESEPVTVVGVVGDIRLLGPAEASLPTVYRPYRQIRSVVESFGFTSRAFVLRTSVASAGLAGPVRDAVRSVDTYALVSGFEPIPEAIAQTLSGRRTTLILLAFFAVGALALGGIGIYGVTAYLVRERRRELGLRVAVGASSGRVVAEVLAGVLKVAGLGSVLGVAAALALSGVTRRFVVEIAPIDPAVLAVAVAAALGLALAAAVVPARSAGRTDPIAVLTGDA